MNLKQGAAWLKNKRGSEWDYSFCRTISTIIQTVTFRMCWCPLLLISSIEAGAEPSSWISNQSAPEGSVWDCPWGLNLYMSPVFRMSMKCGDSGHGHSQARARRGKGLMTVVLRCLFWTLFISCVPPPPLFFIHRVFTIYFQFHWSHCTQPPRRPTEISAIDARNRGERLQITVAISAAIFLCRFIKIADFFYYSLYTVEADLNNILPHVTILYFPVEVKLILICETMKKLRL